MALECATGSITITTGAISTTFTVSGLAFQPIAVFLFWSGRATTGQAEEDGKFGAGFFTSTSARRAYATQSDHSPTTTACDSMWVNTGCVLTLTTAGAVDGRADVDAITSDGFRLIIDDVFTANLQVGWIAWGGSDLTDVAIVDFTEPGSSGNQDITSVGFALNTGLDDKAVIFLGGPYDAAGVSVSGSLFELGMAAGDTIVQGTMEGYADDALGTSDTSSYCRAGEVLFNASVTAWLSNGFRLNWTGSPGGALRHSALVMKGGRWFVGNAVTSTGTSNQTESTPYTPVGILLASSGKTASSAGAFDAHDEKIIGVATSSSSRYSAGVLDKDASANADVGSAFRDDAMYVNQSTAGTIAVEGLMDLVSFDATPQITYVMDDADPGAAFWFYLGAASAAGGGTDYVSTITEQLVVYDEILFGSLKGRTTDNFLTLYDDVLVGALKGRTVDDAVFVIDELVRGALRGATVTDSISVMDEIIRGVLMGRTVDETLTVVDDIQVYRKYVRLLEENLDVIDLLARTLAGGGILFTVIIDEELSIFDETLTQVFYSRLLTDSLPTSDDALIGVLRGRTLDDGAVVADNMLLSASRVRSLDDACEVIDQLLMARKFTRLLTDTLDLTDYLDALVTGPAPLITADVRILIGAQQSIYIGAQQTIELGYDYPIVIGGYN